ncbi:hypothetical protein L1049_017679 [Liquidambar formosana]|uniref:RING-type E3 ubiquitin transferase n=1 Tax=Liquidambar formosana TaxID=63359 RepID=A0AAP0S837_LIQFO
MESSSSSRRPSSAQLNRGRFVEKVISPAIRRQPCPICLRRIDDRRAAVVTVCMHAYCVECIRKWSNLKRKCPLCNAHFNSWFFNINLYSRTFRKEQLPALNDVKNVDVEGGLRHGGRLVEQRFFRSSRDELNSANSRTRPLPWRRSFGRPGSVPPDVVAERVLQWRASIYTRRLQAVPSSSGNCPRQNMSGNNSVKERILQRIEPWIRRELQAILGDPDPSVIVHVATSLFISSLGEKPNCVGVEDNHVAPLRPFLHEQTNMFWHELRYVTCIQLTFMKSLPPFFIACLMFSVSMVFPEFYNYLTPT